MLTDYVEVLLEMPQDIIEGLNDGTYRGSVGLFEIRQEILYLI